MNVFNLMEVDMLEIWCFCVVFVVVLKVFMCVDEFEDLMVKDEKYFVWCY